MFVGTVETTSVKQLSRLSSLASCLQEGLTLHVPEDTCAALLQEKDLILKVKKHETYAANVLRVLPNRSEFLKRKTSKFLWSI